MLGSASGGKIQQIWPARDLNLLKTYKNLSGKLVRERPDFRVREMIDIFSRKFTKK